MMEATPQREMPRYQCHKIVHALRIKSVEFDAPQGNGGAMIEWYEEGYAPFHVDEEYVRKHIFNVEPWKIIGGYFVVYDDGYKSFSPQKAFEDGYTLIPTDDGPLTAALKGNL
jgi:hypothetical protein